MHFSPTLGGMARDVDKVSSPDNPEKPILSRAQLEAIEEDPSKLEVVARLMGAVNLDNLFRHMQSPDVAVNAKIEFQKLLNKMGQLEPDTGSDAAGGGPQVVINITRARDHEHGVTIEGKSVDVGAA